MAELFQTSRTNVVDHIKNIYEEGELDDNSTCRKFRQVRTEGNRQVTRELPFYNLVSGYFDLAEINAIEHKPMYMIDYVEQLDSILTSGNRKLLEDSGKVSHDEAIKKAKAEYRKYQEITLSPVEEEYLKSVKGLEKEVKKRKRAIKK